jgi:hypothetical protein
MKTSSYPTDRIALLVQADDVQAAESASQPQSNVEANIDNKHVKQDDDDDDMPSLEDAHKPSSDDDDDDNDDNSHALVVRAPSPAHTRTPATKRKADKDLPRASRHYEQPAPPPDPPIPHHNVPMNSTAKDAAKAKAATEAIYESVHGKPPPKPPGGGGAVAAVATTPAPPAASKQRDTEPVVTNPPPHPPHLPAAGAVATLPPLPPATPPHDDAEMAVASQPPPQPPQPPAGGATVRETAPVDDRKDPVVRKPDQPPDDKRGGKRQKPSESDDHDVEMVQTGTNSKPPDEPPAGAATTKRKPIVIGPGKEQRERDEAFRHHLIVESALEHQLESAEQRGQLTKLKTRVLEAKYVTKVNEQNYLRAKKRLEALTNPRTANDAGAEPEIMTDEQVSRSLRHAPQQPLRPQRRASLPLLTNEQGQSRQGERNVRERDEADPVQMSPEEMLRAVGQQEHPRPMTGERFAELQQGPPGLRQPRDAAVASRIVKLEAGNEELRAQVKALEAKLVAGQKRPLSPQAVAKKEEPEELPPVDDKPKTTRKKRKVVKAQPTPLPAVKSAPKLTASERALRDQFGLVPNSLETRVKLENTIKSGARNANQKKTAKSLLRKYGPYNTS